MPSPTPIGTPLSVFVDPSNGSSGSLTIPAGANAVVAFCGGFNNETVSSVTLNGSAMENVVSGQNGTNQFGGLFYMDSADANWPGAGTFTLAGNLSGGAQFHLLGVPFQDVDTATQGYRTGVPGSGNVDDPSISLTGMTASTDTMVYGSAFYENQNAAATTGSIVVQVNNGLSASNSILTYDSAPAGASDSIGITTDAAVDHWSGGFALIGTSGGGGTSVPIGQVTETDANLALGKAKAKTLGVMTETDLSQAFGRNKARSIGQISEADIAQGFGKSKAAEFGLVTESDTGLSFGRSKAKTLGLLSETDQVFSISVGGSITVALGLITESNSALALSSAKQKAFGLLTETDLAQSLGVSKTAALGLVSETDSLFSVGSAKAKAIGLVAESDAPLLMSPARAYELGLVTESDIAFITSVAKAANLGLLTETDSVFGITASGPAAPQSAAIQIVVEARNRRIIVEKRDRLIIANPRNRRIDVKKLN